MKLLRPSMLIGVFSGYTLRELSAGRFRQSMACDDKRCTELNQVFVSVDPRRATSNRSASKSPSARAERSSLAFRPRWTGCDLVERVPGKVAGRPIVRGTRILADTIVQDFELGSPLEEIQENQSWLLDRLPLALPEPVHVDSFLQERHRKHLLGR